MNTLAYEAILDDEGLEASHLLSIPPPSARWGAASLPFEKAGIKFLDTCDKPRAHGEDHRGLSRPTSFPRSCKVRSFPVLDQTR